MIAHNIKRFAKLAIWLLAFVMVVGFSACSKKGIKALFSGSSGDVVADGQVAGEPGGEGPVFGGVASEESGEGAEERDVAVRDDEKGEMRGTVLETGEIDESEIAFLDDGIEEDVASGTRERLSAPTHSGRDGQELVVVEPSTEADTQQTLREALPAVEESTAGEMVLIQPQSEESDVVEAPVAVEESTAGEMVLIQPQSERLEPMAEVTEESGPQSSGLDPEVHQESAPLPLIVAQDQGSPVPLVDVEVSKIETALVPTPAGDTFVVQDSFESIYFDFDRWAIPKPMVQRLTDQASWLKARPNSKVVIEGHCDMRGSREYNMVLGEKRARAVRNFLIDLGVKDDQLSVISYGKERLTCFDSEEACHQGNRRAQLVLR